MERIKVLIIGSGPAGFTAAIYAARAALSPVLYEGIEPGGQLTTTTEIENFPGYPEGIQGTEMMNDLRAQALRLGTDVRTGIITDIDTSKRPFVLTIDGEKKIEAEAVIICTGAFGTIRFLFLSAFLSSPILKSSFPDRAGERLETPRPVNQIPSIPAVYFFL